MVRLFYFFVFAYGCVIGSFLNVVIDRIPKRESVIKGRSHCDHCNHKLKWYDLIPIASYLALNGKCRNCEKAISFSYPIVELITGLSFLVVVLLILKQNYFYLLDIRYFITIDYFLYIISSLIVIFFIDLKYGIIPFTIVLYAVASCILWYVLLPIFNFSPAEISIFDLSNYNYLNYLLSGVGVFLFFLIIFLVSKGRGMGFGDVVFVFLMGFILGFPRIILGLYITFLTGAFVSLLLILIGKKKFKGGTVPFGPFLVFGTVICLFWGNLLIEKIMHYLMGG